MWDDDELFLDEKTKVYEKEEAPRSGPILLLNPLLDTEIVEVVEIRTRRRPPARTINWLHKAETRKVGHTIADKHLDHALTYLRAQTNE